MLGWAFWGYDFQSKPESQPNEGAVVELLLEKQILYSSFFKAGGEGVLWAAVRSVGS